MDNKELFRQALGLGAAWDIGSIGFDSAGQETDPALIATSIAICQQYCNDTPTSGQFHDSQRRQRLRAPSNYAGQGMRELLICAPAILTPIAGPPVMEIVAEIRMREHAAWRTDYQENITRIYGTMY